MRRICYRTLLLLVSCSLAAHPDDSSAEKYPDSTRYADAIEAFEAQDHANPPPQGAILCIGSSSIRGWHGNLAADLGPLTVIPRGFGGSNMKDAVHYMDRIVLPYKPRAVLLYEGDNDVSLGVSPEAFMELFHLFVERLHEALPETRVYVLSIKPSPHRWEQWDTMLEANRLLQQACSENALLTYIDVATPLLNENGIPHPEWYADDRLHLNRSGYLIWRNAVRPVLHAAELGRECSPQSSL